MSAWQRSGVGEWGIAWTGALLTWSVTVALAGGQGAFATLSAALSFAVFFVLVAIGQMFVITTGPGNVDLSIPATVTLGGVLAMLVMAGANTLILPGIAAALLAGALVGSVNYLLMRLLRIPPIIATLSMSFLVQSLAIWSGRGLRVKPPEIFSSLMTARVGGVPLAALFALGLSVAFAVLLRRTVYGRTVLAIGQNPRVARLAGMRVERTRWLTYTLSGTMAALTGALFAGFSGGSSLDMGAQFLLASIAVVVIGGTSVAGGRANLPGLWGAALFLFLVVTMLNVLQVSTGVRQVLTGALIVGIVALAGGRRT